MRMALALSALFAALTSSAAAATAADACFSVALPEMDQATTRADSMALATRYQAQAPGGDKKCGALLAGYLIGMTSTLAEDEWRQRQEGITLLESVFSNYTNEPRLHLAMGMLMYHRQARTDALRNLDRAFDRRNDGEVPLSDREVALLHYNRGLMHQDFWRDWRSFGYIRTTGEGQWHCGRYETPGADNFTSSSNDNTWLIGLNQLCPEVFARNIAQFFDHRADMNRESFDNLEAAFQAAMEADPTFLLPAEALLGEYVYLETWDRAEPLARSLYAQFPEDYRPLQYLGLVLHETGRDSAAAPMFGRSFLYMPDSVAAAFDDIAMLLTVDQQTWYAGVDSLTRRTAGTAFWNSLDPLYLTTVNERKIEHYARVVAADLMFSTPALAEKGRDSFAGQMWIRYGRPIGMWELQTPTGRVVFWDYGPGPDISFLRGAAYRSNRPTDEAKQYANALQRTTPQIYQAKALIDTTADLSHQIVRLLGNELRPQLLVYTDWPASYGDSAVAGLALLDLHFMPIAQWRGGKPDRPGLRAELSGLSPGAYSLTIEIWDRETKRLSRMRDTVSTLTTADSSFVVSDMLLASRIRPMEGDDATNRRDVDITPLYGSTAGRGDPLGLYWEVYRLQGEQQGRIDYHVSLEILDQTRQPLMARVLRGVGARGERDAATKIEYESSRPVVGGRAVEWIELTSDLAPGQYRIVLTLTAAGGGAPVTRERVLTVR